MVDELINAQEELAAHVSRALSNYKKSKSKISKSYVDARLELLESDFNIFKTNHLEILKKATQEDRKTHKYFKEDRYYICEDEFIELKALMKEFLHEHAQKSAPAKVISSCQTCSGNHSMPLRTKLPAIEIKSFSGNYNEWNSFYDLFKSLIHSNESLSTIQKYHYLKSNLKGEAEILLRQFPMTEANYEKALELLESRYENKRLIAHSHITRLMNQKKVSIESAKGLRELLDTTNECLSALNNIGVLTTNWDPIVTHIIVSKFDNESHRLWEQKLGGSRDIPTIKDLADFLGVRFRSLEAMNMSTHKDSSSTSKPRQEIKSFTTTSEPLCTYCSEDHYVHNCKDFGKLTPEKRREFAMEKRLCFNCLIPKHSAKFCRQKGSCRVCLRRHHSLLHLSTPPNEPKAIDNAQVEKEEETDTQVAVHKAEISTTQVLLATAMVKVKDKDGRKHTLRALVDQGSQASFITTSAAQRLGLKRLKVCSTITGVDPDVAMTSKEMVEFELFSTHTENAVTQVKAHVLKSLASILPRDEVRISFGSEINKLQLADPTFTTPSGIDLLLGAEVYAQILLDGIKRFGKIIAQRSELGWLVSGTIEDSRKEHNVMFSQRIVNTRLMNYYNGSGNLKR